MRWDGCAASRLAAGVGSNVNDAVGDVVAGLMRNGLGCTALVNECLDAVFIDGESWLVEAGLWEIER